jgi:hypothetical protein
LAESQKNTNYGKAGDFSKLAKNYFSIGRDPKQSGNNL